MEKIDWGERTPPVSKKKKTTTLGFTTNSTKNLSSGGSKGKTDSWDDGDANGSGLTRGSSDGARPPRTKRSVRIDTSERLPSPTIQRDAFGLSSQTEKRKKKEHLEGSRRQCLLCSLSKQGEEDKKTSLAATHTGSSQKTEQSRSDTEIKKKWALRDVHAPTSRREGYVGGPARCSPLRPKN